MEFYNPSDTSKIMKNIIADMNGTLVFRTQDPKNFSLIFNKIVPWYRSVEDGGEVKSPFLSLLVNNSGQFFRIVKDLEQRWNEFCRVLRESGFILEEFVGECEWRMVVGLGGVHPYETSMTLHHVYGVPYIPGSALKGVTRHYGLSLFALECVNRGIMTDHYECIGKLDDLLCKGEFSEKLRDIFVLNGIRFCDLIAIFGDTEDRGNICFLDAFPIGGIKLEVDIINTHYQEYYSGKQPPADWQTPVPVKFLTLGRQSKFKFAVCARKGKESNENSALLSKAVRLLKGALTSFGVGAKTSLGYGLFRL